MENLQSGIWLVDCFLEVGYWVFLGIIGFNFIWWVICMYCVIFVFVFFIEWQEKGVFFIQFGCYYDFRVGYGEMYYCFMFEGQ